MVNPVTPRTSFKTGCNGVKISVRVKPNSKEELVEPCGENEYIVRVKEKAIEGRANAAVIKLLSEHFGVPRSAIIVLRGSKSRNKIIELPA